MLTFLENTFQKAETILCQSKLKDIKIEISSQNKYYFLFKGDSIFDNCLLFLKAGNYVGKLHTQVRSIPDISSLAGKSIESCLNHDDYLIRLLALDIIFSSLKTVPNYTYNINGEEKHKEFAEIITRHVPISNNDKVLVVGADPALPFKLLEYTPNVKVTDLNENRIGKSYLNSHISIDDGNEYTLKYMKESNYVFITGMTFSTGTIDSIISTSKKYNKKLIFYMVSCANLAKELTLQTDSTVFSVGYPTLDMVGNTPINIFT